METKEQTLLVHIEHTKPIEIVDFTKSLTSMGELFTSYAVKNGYHATPKLYVSKIQEGCIDIFLQILTAGAIPFLENANTILDFVGHIKNIKDYFLLGKGTDPNLSEKELIAAHDMLSIPAHDIGAVMKVQATDGSATNVFNDCTFNLTDANGLQNLLSISIKSIKSVSEDENIHERQLMVIVQTNATDGANTKGNKALIADIYSKPLHLFFETDELKNQIIRAEINPLNKLFLVDVVIQTIGENKPQAYKVTKLHEIVDIE